MSDLPSHPKTPADLISDAIAKLAGAREFTKDACNYGLSAASGARLHQLVVDALKALNDAREPQCRIQSALEDWDWRGLAKEARQGNTDSAAEAFDGIADALENV